MPRNDIAAFLEELALGYRIMGQAGLGLGLLAHLTARLPGAETMWTYQLGQSVEEVRAEDLREVDFEARPLSPDARINPSIRVHGAVYSARPDVLAILHHHGEDNLALGATAETLEPIDRNSGRWYGEFAVMDDAEDAPEIAEQGPLMLRALGSAKAMLLRHHGVLVTGRNVRDAVVSAIELERCCRVQLKAMAAGTLRRMNMEEIADSKGFLASDAFADGTFAYYARRLARADAEREHA